MEWQIIQIYILLTRNIFLLFQGRARVAGVKAERSPMKMSRPGGYLEPSSESVGSPSGDTGGRKVRQYHPELLNKAVQLVIEKGMSLSNVSEVMGIPMTTLWRKVKAKDPSAVGAGRSGGGGAGGSPSGRGRGRGHPDPPPPPPGMGGFGVYLPHDQG